jgi:hypothetical protein
MPGELAIILGYKDEISTAKTVWQFSQDNDKLKILGGFVNNELVGADQIAVWRNYLQGNSFWLNWLARYQLRFQDLSAY